MTATMVLEASTAPSSDKKGSQTSSPPHSKRKASLKLSFRWKSGDVHASNTTSSLFSMKAVLERPIAGSQVLFCSLEKKMMDCWSQIEPTTFKVRGETYLRDKKKVIKLNYATYYPFGVDVFLCPRKIDHISRFVHLPDDNSSEKEFEFSRKQMSGANEVVEGLIKELSCLRKTVESSVATTVNGADSCYVLQVDQKQLKSVYQRAHKVEEQAKSYMKQMFSDLNSHCRSPGPLDFD